MVRETIAECFVTPPVAQLPVALAACHARLSRRDEAFKLRRGRGPQPVVLRAERGRVIGPVLAGVQPDRVSDPADRFPVVAGPRISRLTRPKAGSAVAQATSAVSPSRSRLRRRRERLVVTHDLALHGTLLRPVSCGSAGLGLAGRTVRGEMRTVAI